MSLGKGIDEGEQSGLLVVLFTVWVITSLVWYIGGIGHGFPAVSGWRICPERSW
jgi:hypothetical protein